MFGANGGSRPFMDDLASPTKMKTFWLIKYLNIGGLPVEKNLNLNDLSNPNTPFVCQSTTSLGLAQVHLRSPKVAVATGAAARGFKKWYNFFCRNKVTVAN